MMFHNTGKTETRHGNAPQILFVARVINPEVVERSWLCFSPSQTCFHCFTCRLMCANTSKCAHFPIRKGICDWKHAEEPRAINGT